MIQGSSRHGGEPAYDKLYKVRPLLDAAVKNFQSCYNTPTENPSIDESMIGFKGWLAFFAVHTQEATKLELTANTAGVLQGSCRGVAGWM